MMTGGSIKTRSMVIEADSLPGGLEDNLIEQRHDPLRVDDQLSAVGESQGGAAQAQFGSPPAAVLAQVDQHE